MAQATQMNVPEINTPITVEHDKKKRQFTIRLNGSHDRAVLLYEYVGKKTVDLQHTEVPDAYRGRGIAKHLAKEDLLAIWTCAAHSVYGEKSLYLFNPVRDSKYSFLSCQLINCFHWTF
uniref:Protein NATD1 n=1 Tax=Oncorhynchus kisutch TaxID=8019 RepID=A0A8C7HU83_ONCKI